MTSLSASSHLATAPLAVGEPSPALLARTRGSAPHRRQSCAFRPRLRRTGPPPDPEADHRNSRTTGRSRTGPPKTGECAARRESRENMDHRETGEENHAPQGESQEENMHHRERAERASRVPALYRAGLRPFAPPRFGPRLSCFPSTPPRAGDGGVSSGSKPRKPFPQNEAPPLHDL